MKLVLTLRALYLRFIPHKHSRKKQELWERNLSPLTKFRINLRIVWRRFDTQTRGMGFVFVLIIGMMLVVNIVPFFFTKTIQQMESNNYKGALETACKDMQFYSLNFKTCEGISVRP